ncbi:acetyl-CoA carboxylase biotin carboxyl carrier protein [Virgibacillus xinjiangensis]|uniref:Biotin carboxyl carrier protein of acetyl-CoA carboxylase n=1 Tax=Virgibacillus xinjiangensis TaxID=393090 RepID=A0ABV7CRZ9_9BACI
MLKVQEIREIIKLIDKSSITEFSYETEGATVSLKKSTHSEGPAAVSQAETAPAVQQPAQGGSNAVEHPQQEEKHAPRQEQNEPAKEKEADYDYEVVSPMVGTFYAKPTPESDPYVSKGSNVSDDTVVCIVEAMKLFNEIEAEVSGEIVEILADDGELVEYGQPLFRVKKQ